MQPLIEGGDVVVGLGDRVLGRVVAQDVMNPARRRSTDRKRGTLMDEAWVKRLDE